MSNERKFADGIIFKKKPQAPEWVLGGLSIKVDEFVKFLNENKKADGWVNLDIKLSKQESKPYIELDAWEPEGKKEEAPESGDAEGEGDDLPF